MYLNITSRGFPTGIQVGTSSTNRSITLNLDLSLVTYRGIPLQLHAIEIWGCGNAEAKWVKPQQYSNVNKHDQYL